jgi:hypothetical protein
LILIVEKDTILTGIVRVYISGSCFYWLYERLERMRFWMKNVGFWGWKMCATILPIYKYWQAVLSWMYLLFMNLGQFVQLQFIQFISDAVWFEEYTENLRVQAYLCSFLSLLFHKCCCFLRFDTFSILL